MTQSFSIQNQSVLNRLSSISLDHSQASHFQSQVDQSITSFSSQMTDGRQLGSLLIGGTVFRGVRGLILGLPSSVVSSLWIQPASWLGALASESIAFDFSSRALSQEPHRFSFSGQNGMLQTIPQHFLNFGIFRGASLLVGGQNIILRHAVLDTATLITNQLSNHHSSSDLFSQFLQAEIGTCQLEAGMMLTHHLAQGLARFEHMQERQLHAAIESLPTRNHQSWQTSLAYAHASSNVHEGTRNQAQEILQNHISAMTISDVVGWLTGGKAPSRPASLAERPTQPGLKSSSQGQRPPSAPPEPPSRFFESLHDRESITDSEGREYTRLLRVQIPEIATGVTQTMGRKSGKANQNIFPYFFKNISRQHFQLRIIDGQTQIRAHDPSLPILLEGRVVLDPYRWYPLFHGDLVELLSENRLRQIQDSNFEKESTRQPADESLEFFFRDHINSVARPTQMQDLEKAFVPLTLQELQQEIRRLSSFPSGMNSIYNHALNDMSNPYVNGDDPAKFIIPMFDQHRRFIGARISAWPGAITRLLQQYHRFLRTHEIHDLIPHHSAHSEIHRELGMIEDQFQRLFDLIGRIEHYYGENSPIADQIAQMRSAYENLNQASIPKREQIKSPRKTFISEVSGKDRLNWFQTFTHQNSIAGVIRIAGILTGQINRVSGREVGGNFYHALARGKTNENLRNVRAYFNTSTGDLVAFRDGSTQSQERLNAYRDGKTPLGQIEYYIDLSTGKIEHVQFITEPLHESHRIGLEGVVGLQVINEVPEELTEADLIFEEERASGVRQRSTTDEIILFPSTETPESISPRTPLSFEGFVSSELSDRWQIHFPAREEVQLSDIRRVVSITRLPNNRTLLTLDHPLPHSNHDFQIFVDSFDAQGLQPEDTIEVTHRNRTSVTPPPPQVLFGTTEMRMEGDAYRLVSPPSVHALEQTQAQIEAITPIQSTADENGVARMGILTFSANSPVTQLVVTYSQAQQLQVGQTVELSRLER